VIHKVAIRRHDGEVNEEDYVVSLAERVHRVNARLELQC